MHSSANCMAKEMNATRLGCLPNLVYKGDTILCFLSLVPCVRRRCSFGAVYIALGINLKYKPVSSQWYISSGSYSSSMHVFNILDPLFNIFWVYGTCFRRTLLFLFISFCHQPFDALNSYSPRDLATCSAYTFSYSKK